MPFEGAVVVASVTALSEKVPDPQLRPHGFEIAKGETVALVGPTGSGAQVVVDDAQLLQESRSLCEKLANGPTKGYGLIKKVMHASGVNTLDAQLDLERDVQREAGRSEDYREGVSAFKEKRAPRFTGK